MGTDDVVKPLHVHDGLAKLYSDISAAAQQYSWQAAANHVIRLPDELPALFKSFGLFTYSGKIYNSQAKQGAQERQEDPGWPGDTASMRVVNLGRQIGINQLLGGHHRCADTLICEEKITEVEMHAKVYQHTVELSRLRRIFVLPRRFQAGFHSDGNR